MSIREYLRSRNIPFVALLHAPAPSAARFAHSVHVAGERVAKAVLVRAQTGYVLAVVPATHRVDLSRLGRVLGQKDLAIASEDEVVRIFSDCERGALPPFGRLYGLTTVVDSHLAAHREIMVGANTRHEGIRLCYRDYEAVEEPIRARFATPNNPPRRGLTRQAG